MALLQHSWRTQTVPSGQGDRMSYLLVTATPEAPRVRTPLNVSLSLDRSPSMYMGRRPAMPELIEAALVMVDTLQDGDILSIVAYDFTRQVVFPATRIDRNTARQARQAIKSIREGDGTTVSNGLTASLDQLLQNHGPHVVSRLILIADGQTEVGDSVYCQRAAQKIGSYGIPIYAFGLGSEWESELFTELATATGGSCDYLKDGSHISAAFNDAVTTSQGVVARNATMSLELTEGLNLRRAGMVQPAIATEEVTSARTISIPLGDLSIAAPTAVLFEVILPYQDPGTYLAGRVMLNATSIDGRPISEVIDVPVTYAQNPAPPVVAHVANIVERVTAHRLRTTAVQDLAAGEVGRATMKLKNAATRLLELGELALGQETQALAEEAERRGGVSAAGTKSLQHGTRKLTGKLTL